MNTAERWQRRRTRYSDGAEAGASPGFLAAMLCVVCVMSLFTLVSGLEKRQRTVKNTDVALAGVPKHLVPLQIRCSARRVAWFDADAGKWREAETTALKRYLKANPPAGPMRSVACDLCRFLENKVKENGRLSYLPERRMNMVLLWIQPDGVATAEMVQQLIAVRQWPLRVGKVAVFATERIRPDAFLPEQR